MNKQKVILAILYVGAAITVSGCVLAAVGAGAAGTVAYVKGDLEILEAKGLDDVYAASKKALEGLELTVIQDNKDKIGATLVSRDSQDKKITITLKAVTDESTEISIRYGTFGSEAKSSMIYNKIKENLK
ncbi:MAG: DUF3568 family protein [Sedimentisphaerales bacterium]|nr:DUF3568 family protein [Sedimentisphaerales bacterium]